MTYSSKISSRRCIALFVIVTLFCLDIHSFLFSIAVPAQNSDTSVPDDSSGCFVLALVGCRSQLQSTSMQFLWTQSGLKATCCSTIHFLWYDLLFVYCNFRKICGFPYKTVAGVCHSCKWVWNMAKPTEHNRQGFPAWSFYESVCWWLFGASWQPPTSTI